MNVLLRYTLAFVAGILLHDAIPTRWLGQYSGVAIWGGVALLLVIGFWGLIFGKLSRLWLGIVSLWIFVGTGWLRSPRHTYQCSIWDVSAYEAVVLSPPETRAKTYKVEVEILKGRHQNTWKPLAGKVLLYIDKNAQKPRYGDVLLIRGVSRLVEGPLNPAQFDYKKFLMQKRIYHQHYLKTTDFVFTGKQQGIWYKKWAYSVSEWSDAALKKLVPYEREYAVAKAMVLGLRDEMDNELVQAYSAAGAVHVLSVSGFHIGVFVWLLTKILGTLKKRRRGKWAYLGITLIVLWFYAIMTGLSAPVIRSAVMFTIFLLANPLGRKENAKNALFGSALMLLALDPLLIYSVSFQLSYAALGGIIYLQPILYQSITVKDWFLDKIWGLTAVALTAQLATFPLGAYYFHQFPNYFWLVNPLVVGLSFVMLPLAFIAILLSWIPLLSSVLGWLLTGVTWLLNQAVIWTEQLPYSVFNRLSLSWLEVVIIYGIIGLLLALLYYRDRRWLWGTGALSLLLFFTQIIEMQDFKKQKYLIIHAIPHQTAISLIVGQEATLVADSAFFQDNYKAFDFYLKNFYVERGIHHIVQESLETPSSQGIITPLPFGKLIVWQGKKLLLVEKTIASSLPPVADYVIIRNNAFRNSAKLKAFFGNQKLYFDNSNKFYVLDTLQKQAATYSLPWYFVSQRGAFIAHF
jgi:competence protein ComEC